MHELMAAGRMDVHNSNLQIPVIVFVVIPAEVTK